MKFTTWSLEQLSVINLSGTKKLAGMEKVGNNIFFYKKVLFGKCSFLFSISLP